MGFLDRFRRTPATSTEAARERPDVTDVPDVPAEDIREYAIQAIFPGFMSREESIQSVRDVLEIEDTDTRPESMVEEIWQQRLAEEASWGYDSDCRRLEAAFAQLQEAGVVARMNFTCCNTCGTDEIDAERTPIEVADGYPFQETAYTFFHQQDAERLGQDPTVLYLTFSSWMPAADTDPAMLSAARAGDSVAREAVTSYTDTQVGVTVTEALRTQGLTVNWDGDHLKRIAVEIERWRKPLPR